LFNSISVISAHSFSRLTWHNYTSAKPASHLFSTTTDWQPLAVNYTNNGSRKRSNIMQFTNTTLHC